MKKLICLLAAAALLAWPVSAAGAESELNPAESWGENGFAYRYYDAQLGGKPQKIFYADFMPSADSAFELAVHRVTDADGGTKLTRVLDIARDFERETGRKVYAAVNGDFFYNTGGNVDSMVLDGIVYTQGNLPQKHCFGVDNLGAHALGRMTEADTKLRVSPPGQPPRLIDVEGVNRAPSADGKVSVYTLGSNVTVKSAGKYKISTSSVNLTQYPVFGAARRTVVGEVVDDAAFSVGTGEFVVVAKGDNELSRYLYDNLQYGTPCDLVQQPAGEFAGMRYVVGGYDMLVQKGIANTRVHTDNDGDRPKPRTMVGAKADGSLFVAVVDGGGGAYSAGLTVAEEARLAVTLGAYDCLELDGGGSSTFVLRKDGELTLVNKPTDPTPRHVSNAVLIVEKAAEGGDGPEPPDVSPSGQPTADPAEPGGGCGCGGARASAGILLAVTAAVFVFKGIR